MAHITTVDVTNGVPTAGTGTVYTIDQLITVLQTIFGSTAFDLGSGTGGTRTLRFALDSSQVDSVADGSSDSGTPAKIGTRSVAGASSLAALTAGQRGDTISDLDRAMLARQYLISDLITPAVVTCTSGANTSAIAAQGVGVKTIIHSVQINNVGGSASGFLLLTDGTGGTTRAKIPYTTIGAVYSPPVPITGFSANTAVFADPTGSDTIDVVILASKSKI